MRPKYVRRRCLTVGHILVASLWMGVLSGCSDGQASSGSQSAPIPPATASGSWYLQALPLSSVSQLVIDTHLTAGVAVDKRLEDCMASKGFVYRGNSSPPGKRLLFERYGLVPGDSASEYVPDKAEPQPPLVQVAPASQSAAYRVALFGTENMESAPSTSILRDSDGKVVGQVILQGGCIGTATDGLFGSRADYATYLSDDAQVQLLLSSNTDVLWSDRRVRAKVAPWASCVAATGSPNPSRLDFFELYSWPSNTATEQMATARADLSCKTKTRVVQDVFAIDWVLQNVFIEKYHELFTRYAEYINRMKEP